MLDVYGNLIPQGLDIPDYDRRLRVIVVAGRLLLLLQYGQRSDV